MKRELRLFEEAESGTWRRECNIKKAASTSRRIKIARFEFIRAHKAEFSIASDVKYSRSPRVAINVAGSRNQIPPELQRNKALENDIKAIYDASNGVYGGKNQESYFEETLKERNFKWARSIISASNAWWESLKSEAKSVKKYKATTNSNHKLPQVVENLLDRDFDADSLNQKLVSDIDLYRNRWRLAVCCRYQRPADGILGYPCRQGWPNSFTDALEDARRRGGSQWTRSYIVIKGVSTTSWLPGRRKEYGYTCSMSRKGNCWDNAPMESFWGKMKMNGWMNTGSRQSKKPRARCWICLFFIIESCLHEALTIWPRGVLQSLDGRPKAA